jgi:hypothetical protein
MSMRPDSCPPPLVVFLLAMLVSSMVPAQEVVTYQFRANAGPDAITNMVGKQIHSMVKEIDPEGIVSFHEDLVKMKLAGTNAASLAQLLAQLGAGTFALDGAGKDPRPQLATERSVIGHDPGGPDEDFAPTDR